MKVPLYTFGWAFGAVIIMSLCNLFAVSEVKVISLAALLFFGLVEALLIDIWRLGK